MSRPTGRSSTPCRRGGPPAELRRGGRGASPGGRRLPFVGCRRHPGRPGLKDHGRGRSSQRGQHLRGGVLARGHRPVHVPDHTGRSRFRPSGPARPAHAAPSRSGSRRWARTGCRSSRRSRARPASRARRSRPGRRPWARNSERRSRGRPCAVPRERPSQPAGLVALEEAEQDPRRAVGRRIVEHDVAPSPSPVAWPLNPSVRQKGSS